MEIVWLLAAVLLVFIFFRTIRVVPQRSQFVVERLGRYTKTLDAGFHILVPFVDRVAYKHSLKEMAIDVPSQTCITKDNISVHVDGVLYLQVVDARAASYGIDNYLFATQQLCQTTLRSEVGRIELDRTFEERDTINAKVVSAVDQAAEPWGVKILRYEIKDLLPPESVRDALEKQMRAERERRAVVATSEGDRQAKINVSEGAKQEAINLSEAEKTRQINTAEGKAREIELLAEATATGLRTVAEAINAPGGREAVQLRVAEQWIKEWGNLARETNTMIVPANVADVAGMLATAMSTLNRVNQPPAEQ
jgi:regulator of protease activity HflC (stomatin/prohibitin superfamily)